jgi:hypothetical protein
MPRRVKIAPGFNDITLPDGRQYDAGDEVVLTDAQFARIASTAIGDEVLDLGEEAAGGAVDLSAYEGEDVAIQLTGSVSINGPTGVSIMSDAAGGQITFLLVDALAEQLSITPTGIDIAETGGHIGFFGATAAAQPDGVSAADALETLGLAVNVTEGGGGDPFPPDPGLGGMRAYIIANEETLAITTADFGANLTISGTSSMGLMSTTSVVQLNGGAAGLALDPSDSSVALSGTLLGFYGATPVARPNGASAADALEALGLAVNVNGGKGFVNHGATAGTARPTGFESVEWYGSVEPTNAVDGDTWFDTSA